MKQRDGFVSNSSSSSFVIGCAKEPTIPQLARAFGIVKKSMFGKLLKEYQPNLEEMSFEDFKDNYGGEIPEEYEELLQHCINKGWKIFYGSASDDDYTNVIETAICFSCGSYFDDEIAFVKPG